MNEQQKSDTDIRKIQNHVTDRLKVSSEDIAHLFKQIPDYEARNRFYVLCVGILFSPISIAGALMGYIRGYNRFMRPYKELPDFYPMRPIIRVAMISGAILFNIVLFFGLWLLYGYGRESGYPELILLCYFLFNLIFSAGVFAIFKRWQTGVNNAIIESDKFGSARFARADDVAHLKNIKGIYIGGGHAYEKQGHILTVAGSRSGKFTNLLANNLLGLGDIDGSWVIIDPKGEICAVTHDYQGKIGQKIVVLNPWGIVQDNVPTAHAYNPLDILDVTSPDFVDDCQMLAEMLVPVENGRNKFFSDSARSIITGLIAYIAVSEQGESRTLKTLWKWVRYPQEEWDRVLAEMLNYEESDPNSENLLFAASEIEKLAKAGGNTWGSILATVLQATEFLKSPALQASLLSGFDPKTLAHANTTLYVIIPADKLQSHSRWLRLVVTSTMRAVIRKPNKRVVFMLDEFAALGYLPEIETALSTYAGFNVTVWPILQSLVQLQNLYEKNWEVFVGNSAVRHYFGIHNNFDAEYISKAIGKTSHVLTTSSWFGVNDAKSTERYLITPDELRIASGSAIFTFIDDLPPTHFRKMPYYEFELLNESAGGNPYYQQ